jgi:Icc-related predicted phosphoesterase
MRIVCLSDSHNRHAALRVPDGDVLLHAGDATMHGTAEEVAGFDAWLARLPHRHKVVVAGNHDFLFEREPEAARALLKSAVYLQDSGVEVDGLRIWGSPWQPWFFDWAFNLPRGAALKEKWDLIPEGTDVLITHGPPHRILDRVAGPTSRVMATVTGRGSHVGCEELREAVFRLRPRLHVFGHIHESYGQESRDGITFVNASTCNRSYRPANPPVLVDL